jgi:hypothetical protein
MLSRRSFFAAAAGVLAGAAGVAAAAPIQRWEHAGDARIRGALPNDLTRQQMAADLPVIGGEKLPKNTPVQERRHRQLLKKCNDENPPKNETDAQYLKRLSLPCPGRLE